MKTTKKRIALNISETTSISTKESEALVNEFLKVIKKNASNNIIKISNFGSFFYKLTPKRLGRNPKTGVTYSIKPFDRFIFKPSNRLKIFLN